MWLIEMKLDYKSRQPVFILFILNNNNSNNNIVIIINTWYLLCTYYVWVLIIYSSQSCIPYKVPSKKKKSLLILPCIILILQTSKLKNSKIKWLAQFSMLGIGKTKTWTRAIHTHTPTHLDGLPDRSFPTMETQALNLHLHELIKYLWISMVT